MKKILSILFIFASVVLPALSQTVAELEERSKKALK